MKVQKIEINNKEYQYYLQRKNVKNINIRIKPSLDIEVSASEEVPISSINKNIKRRINWIDKNITYFKKSFPTNKNRSNKEYVSGESIKYLGKQYRLKIINSENEGVKFTKGYIYMYVKNPKDFKRKKKLLEIWFKDRCEIIFKNSLNKMFKLIKKYDIEKPSFKIRVLKSRWGSCFRLKNQIVLNSDLIEAPKFCIDYVILHELIHFKYENHNKEFYSLLSVLMPDWKKRKEILDFEVIRDL